MSKPTARDKAQHRSFYEWVKATFPTRYTMSQNFTGLYLVGGSIGFSFPMDGVTDLYHRIREFDTYLWTRLDLHTSHQAARKAGKLTDKEFARYQRIRHTLGYRLIFWKAAQVELAQYTGITGDIRQLAQLAVILDYKVEAENPKS
jgi:hypothetical protein